MLTSSEVAQDRLVLGVENIHRAPSFLTVSFSLFPVYSYLKVSTPPELFISSGFESQACLSLTVTSRQVIELLWSPVSLTIRLGKLWEAPSRQSDIKPTPMPASKRESALQNVAGKEPGQPRDAKGQSRSHWPAMEHSMSKTKWEKKKSLESKSWMSIKDGL